MKSASRMPSSIPYPHRWLGGQFLRYAYVLHEERGGEDGHAKRDWSRAEAAILGTGFGG